MKLKPIHPFAARMAPEIAFEALDGLNKEAIILDPMTGSGTVMKTISLLGFDGYGIDIDPLSIMLTEAWTMPVNEVGLRKKIESVIKRSRELDETSIHLDWIDTDRSTEDFISFWFHPIQIYQLRQLASVIHADQGKYSSILKVLLSKLIITKRKGASLAADISHSRPHRVRSYNDFDVFEEFEKASKRLIRVCLENPPKGKVKVQLGDARKLRLKSESVDSIITSPPYLNAIDYMRGHKLSLVWLGHKISSLSQIRSSGVGAERAPDTEQDIKKGLKLTNGIVSKSSLPNRKVNMICRYAVDMNKIFAESHRVLKRDRKATFVIGNTYQNGVLIDNAAIASRIAYLHGFKLSMIKEREIPENRRYLPPPNSKEQSNLKHRMKSESVMTFLKI